MTPSLETNLKLLLDRYEKEIEKCQLKLSQLPGDDLLKVHSEFNEFLQKTQGVKGTRTTPEAIKFIKELSVREERAQASLKRKVNYDKVNERLIQLELNKRNLVNIMWRMSL